MFSLKCKARYNLIKDYLDWSYVFANNKSEYYIKLH